MVEEGRQVVHFEVRPEFRRSGDRPVAVEKTVEMARDQLVRRRGGADETFARCLAKVCREGASLEDQRQARREGCDPAQDEGELRRDSDSGTPQRTAPPPSMASSIEEDWPGWTVTTRFTLGSASPQVESR